MVNCLEIKNMFRGHRKPQILPGEKAKPEDLGLLFTLPDFMTDGGLEKWQMAKMHKTSRGAVKGSETCKTGLTWIRWPSLTLGRA